MREIIFFKLVKLSCLSNEKIILSGHNFKTILKGKGKANHLSDVSRR